MRRFFYRDPFSQVDRVTLFPRSLLRHVTCQIEDFKRLFCKPSGRLLPNKTLPSQKNQPSLRVLFFFFRHFKVRWHLYDAGSACVCIPESPFENPAGELLRNLNESEKYTEVVGVVCKDPARRNSAFGKDSAP